MSANPERLLALFDALVELGAGERAARLEALRSEDAALADELARMLAADGAGGVLDRGMAAMAATVAGELDRGVRAAGAAPGRRVGPFSLERLLGRGGMGEVWLAAREEAGFRQEVALKLLKRGMDSEDLLRRFVQERRILAGLSHPGIARFIDGGVGDDGAPWYAMEYVEGVPLTEHARQRALDVRARVELVAAVAEAVAYAQNRLVVHRDLKPSNILVDPQGRVRLLDFGIAKLLDEAPGADATATGVRAMSPAYASPEQILDEPVSAATDVYALGVVLYELLAGALPHERENATLETLADRVRNETPPRPSARLRASGASIPTIGATADTAQRFARQVAGELDTIVLAALRREPERRYASAAAFADDLRRWLDGRPVAAQADTAGYRARKFVTRHRFAVGSASAVLLALVAGFGTALWQARVARSEAARANVAAARAQSILDFTLSLFREQDPTARATREARSPGQLVAEGIERARVQFAEGDPLRIEVLDQLGALQVDVGDPAAAEAVLAEVVAARIGDEPAQRVARARSQSAMAVALARRSDIAGGIAMARAAAGVLDAELGPEHPDSIEAGTRLLTIAVVDGSEQELTELGTRLLARASAGLGAAAPQTLSILFTLSQVQERFDRLDAANASLAELVARTERAYGPGHALLVRPLGLQGDILRRLRRYDEALPLYDRAVAIAEAQGARAILGAVRMRRGDLLRRMGRNEAARADLEAAAGLVAADSPQRAQVEQFLGSLARARGDTDAAVAHFSRARQGFERALGKPSVYSWTNVLSLAQVEAERGNAVRVAPLAREALAAMRVIAPAPSVDVFLGLSTVAQVEAALGRREAAVQAAEEAMQVGTAVYSADHEDVLRAQLLRAENLPTGSAEQRSALRELLAVPGLGAATAARARAALAPD